MYGTRLLHVPQLPVNDHLHMLNEYFGGIKKLHTSIPEEVRFIFLGFTNRSGSNYTAQLLASDDLIPLAGENLNADTVISHSKRLSLNSIQEYFSFLVRHTRKNNLVSIKVAPTHLEILGRAGILDQIIDRTHFILIERADKLAQAISHVIAFQTGRFTSIEKGQEGVKPVFKREDITNVLIGHAEAYKEFNLFFGSNGLVPAHIIYEQLVLNPERVIRYIGRTIGIPSLTVNPNKLSLIRQANALNEEWRKLYLGIDTTTKN